MKKLVALACALWLLGACALAQGQPAAETEAQLRPLLVRQAELYERAAAAAPEDTAEDIYTPDSVRALGVLTLEEEALFNRIYAQIALLQGGPRNVVPDTAALQEIPLTWNTPLPDRVDALNAQADALWAQIAPLARRLEEAWVRAHLQVMGLALADIDTYLSVHQQAYALQAQADALYRGWRNADMAGRAAIEGQATALNRQAEQLLESISSLTAHIYALENDHYYKNLAGLSDEERAELKQLDDHITDYYRALYRPADNGRN